MLETLGQLAFALQRAEGAPRLLQRGFQLCNRLSHVVHNCLLLSDRLDVDSHVIQQTQDDIRLVLDLVEEFPARVDRDDALVGFGDPRR